MERKSEKSSSVTVMKWCDYSEFIPRKMELTTTKHFIVFAHNLSNVQTWCGFYGCVSFAPIQTIPKPLRNICIFQLTIDKLVVQWAVKLRPQKIQCSTWNWACKFEPHAHIVMNRFKHLSLANLIFAAHFTVHIYHVVFHNFNYNIQNTRRMQFEWIFSTWWQNMAAVFGTIRCCMAVTNG